MIRESVDELVHTAILQNGMALEYAQEEHRDNFKYVFIAIKSNPQSIKFASSRVKSQLCFQRSLTWLIDKSTAEEKEALEKMRLAIHIHHLNEF
jgi:hypothetical protein